MPTFIDRTLDRIRRRRVPTTRALGARGTSVFGGFLEEREKNKQLSGEQRYRTFSDLLANVSIVAASVRYYLGMISRVSWDVEPPEHLTGAQRDEAERLAELVEGMLHDMSTPWHRVIRRAAGYKLHGFSVQEWTAKRRDDGIIGMLDVESRPQVTIERWDLDTAGTVQGMVQRSPQTQEAIYLPRGKVVYMVDDALNDSPEGIGLLRHAAESALRLQTFQVLESYGLDTDLRGTPVVRAPLTQLEEAVQRGQITEAQKREAIEPLTQFIEKHAKRPDLGLLIDSEPHRGEGENAAPTSSRLWDVELLQGGSSQGHEAVANSIERLNREIARMFGTEMLLLGEDGGGSLALARSKTEMFALLIDSALTEITESFESDFIDPVFRLNGWEQELQPTLKPESVQFRDVEQIGAVLRDMAQAGAILAPDDPVINAVRDLMGLPQIDLDMMAEDAALDDPKPNPDPSNDPPAEVPPVEPDGEIDQMLETPREPRRGRRRASRALGKVVAPGGTESRDEFIERCMSAEAEAFPDEEQRLAVCASKWRESQER